MRNGVIIYNLDDCVHLNVELGPQLNDKSEILIGGKKVRFFRGEVSIYLRDIISIFRGSVSSLLN